MPIRWRLTLWFSLMLFVILIIAGGVLYFLLQRYLTDTVDNNLKSYTARVHGVLIFSDNEKIDYNMIHSKLPPINEFAFPGIYIQIIDGSGNVVVKSDNLGNQTLPVNLSIVERGFQGYEVMETVAAGENASVRIMATPLRLRDKTLLLEIAQSLRPINDTMGHLRLAFLGGTLIALALAVISGAALVRRTLNPVERITRTARTIEASSDLSRRVGYKGPADEIGQLATTFDHMLERLHGAFQSQKHFVADASHELRTPLTVIRGNLDLLKRNLTDADRKECLKAIEAESGRMSKIVNDLLLLAEIESGEMEKQEEVSLKEIVLEEYKRAQTVAGGRRIVTGKLEELTVTGDSYKLRQLLDNLVSNAIRYTPETGTITLSVFRNDEWARLEVADTGIGIAPEHQSHIFDRFYRIDKARSRANGGTGLGLAIVKGIAERHRGKVTVVSEPGRGSTFTAWLKLCPPGRRGLK